MTACFCIFTFQTFLKTDYCLFNNLDLKISLYIVTAVYLNLKVIAWDIAMNSVDTEHLHSYYNNIYYVMWKNR